MDNPQRWGGWLSRDWVVTTRSPPETGSVPAKCWPGPPALGSCQIAESLTHRRAMLPLHSSLSPPPTPSNNRNSSRLFLPSLFVHAEHQEPQNKRNRPQQAKDCEVPEQTAAERRVEKGQPASSRDHPPQAEEARQVRRPRKPQKTGNPGETWGQKPGDRGDVPHYGSAGRTFSDSM